MKSIVLSTHLEEYRRKMKGFNVDIDAIITRADRKTLRANARTANLCRFDDFINNPSADNYERLERAMMIYQHYKKNVRLED